ncbi:hypothetical protein T492DRAFT_839194 [Pavlovales sp. CCMP2436]|nr:hypothetical protein T492DRAFT_839194 [Pavlovales sp. CCMP2436]
MSPFKGQGANQALVDALELARALAGAGLAAPELATHALAPEAAEARAAGDDGADTDPVARALLAFERSMAARAGAKADGSRRAAQVLHSAAALVEGDHVRAHVAEGAAGTGTLGGT